MADLDRSMLVLRRSFFDHIRGQRQMIIVSRIRYRKVRGLGPVMSSILVSRGEPQPLKNVVFIIEIPHFSFFGLVGSQESSNISK